MRRDAITDEDIQHAARRSHAFRARCAPPSTTIVPRSVIHTCAAGLPAPLRRFLYGDRPLPEPRRTLADWPKITAPTLLIWGEQDVALERS